MADQEFEVVAKLRIRQAKIEDAKDLQTYCFPAQDLETVTQSLTADLEQAESKDVVRLVADASGHAVRVWISSGPISRAGARGADALV